MGGINKAYKTEMEQTHIGGDLVRGLGNEVGALAPKNFFCRPLQNVKFGGTAGDSLYSRIVIFNPWILCVYYGY